MFTFKRRTQYQQSPIKKRRLTFKDLFGNEFKSGKKAAIDNAAQLLISDHLNLDGTIDSTKITDLTESILWSYIYYLYIYNHNEIPEFTSMKSEDGNASAERFYDVVRSRVDGTILRYHNDLRKLTLIELVKFINIVIKKYGLKLKNPVIEHYNNMLINDIQKYMQHLKVNIRTGERYQPVIVTDPVSVKSSDIIIDIKFDNQTKKL